MHPTVSVFTHYYKHRKASNLMHPISMHCKPVLPCFICHVNAALLTLSFAPVKPQCDCKMASSTASLHSTSTAQCILVNPMPHRVHSTLLAQESCKADAR